MELKKKIASAIAASALLLNTALPVLATTIEIVGNGSDSMNKAEVGVTNTTNVVQNNYADISNDVDVEADTGDNDAKDNTGGEVSIQTGDADVVVGVSNTVNSNSAEVDGCCEADADVLIAGNGTDSRNHVELGMSNQTAVFQSNMAKIENDVDAEAETGDNDAEDNTGGEVSVETGDASVTVVVSNEANSNSARIGGGSGGSSVSLRILGNGSDSRNHIELGLVRSTVIEQNNMAMIKNKVKAEAETGDNDAKDNTGGDVSIETGDADVFVGIDNLANFNWADLDCGCLLDVTAKIAGNGTDSRNHIKAGLSDVSLVFQNNVWRCGRRNHRPSGGFDLFGGGGQGGRRGSDCNDVDVEAETGDNDAEDNTGDVDGGDPSIETGDADVEVLIENAGNLNSVGAESPDPVWEWPSGFSFNLNISFSLSDLLAALGLS